jgi:4-carboxymuconolactone decarboxylase
VVAAHKDSAFERESHEAVGRTVGLTEAEVADLREARRPPLADAREAAVWRLTRALADGDVDEPTWAECVPPLDEETVFELTTLVGYYTTLALQLRVFRV